MDSRSSFLGQAHRDLADSSLLVGIPARGHLYASSLTQVLGDPRHSFIFQTIVSQMYRDAEQLGITPLLFMVVDGVMPARFQSIETIGNNIILNSYRSIIRSNTMNPCDVRLIAREFVGGVRG